ncbi:hypothetical protein IJ596_06860 [bacterium]|nr:hypothetical protein [bacterium]
MVEKINSCIQQHYNYNTTINPVVKPQQPANNSPVVNFDSNKASVIFGNSTVNTEIRTQLSNREEKKKYSDITSSLDKNSRKVLETLLKNGVLLNSKSNDNSTVLDNLHKILTEPRAQGLDNIGILKDIIATVAYPFLITQQFGNIPNQFKQNAIQANGQGNPNDINVQQSGTCVAASTEFKLAKQMPAEFARLAKDISSPQLSSQRNIKLDNLADNTLTGIWLLNAFEIPFKMNNYNDATLTFAPDKNAIIRAQIQTADKDPYERTPLDVLMQSTFMQIGSQQSYNSLTDKRTGKFNQNDKGLIEFEKTFTESVVFDKNILSVTYQTVDENARLIGYETDLNTMKKHLTTALDMGENIIIGYTQTDANNIIINGHEITIVGYKQNKDGKLTFICNDTDDDISKPIEYNEDYLLPKIHHAALPKEVVEADMNVVPTWVEGIAMFKEMKKQAVA